MSSPPSAPAAPPPIALAAVAPRRGAVLASPLLVPDRDRRAPLAAARGARAHRASRTASTIDTDHFDVRRRRRQRGDRAGVRAARRRAPRRRVGEDRRQRPARGRAAVSRASSSRTVPWGSRSCSARSSTRSASGIGLLFFVVPGVRRRDVGRRDRAGRRRRGHPRAARPRGAAASWCADRSARSRSSCCSRSSSARRSRRVAGALLDLLPHTWAEPTGEYVVHVLTSPLFGMATAVLYYALRRNANGPGRETSPPERARLSEIAGSGLRLRGPSWPPRSRSQPG